MEQVVQIIGSMLVLSAFAAGQRGWLSLRSRVYLALNLMGSSVLAFEAAVRQQWGFLLLEGVWAVVSAGSLIAQARRPEPRRS